MALEPLRRALDTAVWAATSGAEGAGAVVVVTGEWCRRQQIAQW